MLNKLWLCHNINRFYHIFGEAIGVIPTHTKLRDLNNPDFLLGVQFDIMEALEAYKYGFSEEEYETHAWLNKIHDRITTLHETHKHNLLKATAIALAIVSTLAIGYFIGRSNTIRQAELLETTNDGYFISFGDEVHEYTFEEVR